MERRSGLLPPGAPRQLDTVTRSLVKKLLHGPTLRLRTLDEGDDGLRHLESLRYLIGLAEAEDSLAQVRPIDSTPVPADSRPPHMAQRLKVSRRP
jgi:Glutamyl-tRNAGlu reductase, dimerisation domain